MELFDTGVQERELRPQDMLNIMMLLAGVTTVAGGRVHIPRDVITKMDQVVLSLHVAGDSLGGVVISFRKQQKQREGVN